MTLCLQRLINPASGITAKKSNYVHVNRRDVIPHPRPNFIHGLVKLQLKLWHSWVLNPTENIGREYSVHAQIGVTLCQWESSYMHVCLSELHFNWFNWWLVAYSNGCILIKLRYLADIDLGPPEIIRVLPKTENCPNGKDYSEDHSQYSISLQDVVYGKTSSYLCVMTVTTMNGMSHRSFGSLL